jgi:hypothetical protein
MGHLKQWFLSIGFLEFFWENLKVKGLSKTPKTSKTTRIAASNGGERERERERDLPNPIDVQDRGNGGEEQGTGVTAMAALPWEELMGQLPSSLLLTAPSPCRSATHKTQQKKTHTH